MNNYFTGKTVDEAVASALETLGLKKDQVEITVVENAAKGLFGIGGHPAKVLVTKKKDALDETVSFLEGLFEKMGAEAEIDVTKKAGDKIVIDLKTNNSSALIGYRGEVLDSIQCLAGAIYNSDKDDYSKVVVDCENYREKREKTLVSLAYKLADKAVRTSRKITLEPMNPFERRIIHSALSDFDGVKTESEGKEPNRYVAIIPDGYDPEKAKKYERRDNDKRGRRGGKDRKGGRSDFDKGVEKPREKREKKPFGMGTFLGNSLKDNQE